MERLEVKTDDVAKVLKSMAALATKEVLVGIPDGNNSRENDPEVTNSQIGYAMEFGLPANNVPARPFLIPGVKSAQERTTLHLRKAAEFAAAGDPRYEEALNRAGSVARDAVKATIRSNIPPPLKPGTIAGRKYARGKNKRGKYTARPGELEYARLVGTGVSPEDAQAQAGITALINTAQLLNAITYVIRKAK